MNSILENRKMRVENQTKNSSLRGLELMVNAQKPRLKMPFQFLLWTRESVSLLIFGFNKKYDACCDLLAHKSQGTDRV
jgi:hypothetical protein